MVSVLLLTVADDEEGDALSGGQLAQGVAELFFALDGLAVELKENVVDLDPGGAGGAVVIDEDDLFAATVADLEGAELVVGNLAEVDAEIADGLLVLTRVGGWNEEQGQRGEFEETRRHHWISAEVCRAWKEALRM